jgi:hypothetical protein
MTISHMALIETSKQTSAQLVLQISNIFILKFKYQCSKRITTSTNFIQKFKHLHCKCQSVSKIDGQRNQEGDGPGSGSGLGRRGQGSRVGDRVPGSGWGTEVGVRTRVLRSGRWAWLVTGAGLASVGCRALDARGIDLRESPWRRMVAVFGAAASGSGRSSGAAGANIVVRLGMSMSERGEETGGR